MKHYLLFLLASLALLTGCEKDDDPTSVSLRSITREKFDYKGGLASAIVDAGGRDVTAESSESWCRTAVIGSARAVFALRERECVIRVLREFYIVDSGAGYRNGERAVRIGEDERRGYNDKPPEFILNNVDQQRLESFRLHGDRG